MFKIKIITNDEVYVQKNDLAYLYSSSLPIPSFIYNKLLESIEGFIDDSNRYDFVKFEEKSEIEYFKGLEWMIDYNEVKDLSEEETTELLESIANEHETIAQKYNSMSDEERMHNIEMFNQCDRLEFKFNSLRDILWFKQRNIFMKLPNDYSNTSIQEKGIKKTFENKEIK